MAEPKIYTKTGDQGDTGLLGGPRVAKDSLRPETVGTVDELNALLGMVRAESPSPDIDALLDRIQHDLFDLGAELATPEPAKLELCLIGTADVEALERAIDRFEGQLAPLANFILPGGTRAAATLHLARTVCRRAERRLVTLVRESQQPVSPVPLVYLNRLSDLLFVLARAANAAEGRGDVVWKPTR